MIDIAYYQKENGSYPVRDFINNLPVALQSKTQVYLGMLARAGSGLRMPYSRHLADGIFELRISRNEMTIRILYFFNEGNAVLTNGFVKKSKTTPLLHLKRAEAHKAAYLRERNQQ